MGLLFLLFVALPILELYFLIQIGSAVGAFNTIVLVFATGALGAWLAKTQGLKVLGEWQQATAEGRMPTEGVLSGVLVLVGAAVLMTPGILTDLAGFALLIPTSRALIAARVRAWVTRQIAQGHLRVQTHVHQRPGQPPHQGPVRPSRVVDASFDD